MGAINKLFQIGIRAFIIEETNPDEAIKQLIAGTLKAVDPSTVQHTHDHNHGEGGCQGHH
jgi:predicted Fe-Mo cluster-binding NifX family protein